MLKRKIFTTCLLSMILTLCLYLSLPAHADDSCSLPIPTEPGNFCAGSTIAWDDAGSADTIARNSSRVLTIIEEAGKGGPYTWSVSEKGFSLKITEPTGTSNTLYTDGTACGSATIKVIGCDGKTEVTGYVRCTYGAWALLPKGYVWPHAPVSTGTVIGNLRLNGGYQNCYGSGGGFPYSDGPPKPDVMTKTEAEAACERSFSGALNSIAGNACCNSYQLFTQGCLQNILPPYPPPVGYLQGSWNKWFNICEDQGSFFTYSVMWYQCTARVSIWGC